jgi:hypothetical protein
VVVADTTDLAAKEAEYDRGISLATDPGLKRDLEEAKTKLAAARMALREKSMQNSVQGQSIALAVLVVAIYCLSGLIRSEYPVRLRRWLAAGANLGVVVYMCWSTYQLLTLPYDKSTGLGMYAFCWHLIMTILALLASLVLQVWLTFHKPARP